MSFTFNFIPSTASLRISSLALNLFKTSGLCLRYLFGDDLQAHGPHIAADELDLGFALQPAPEQTSGSGIDLIQSFVSIDFYLMDYMFLASSF